MKEATDILKIVGMILLALFVLAVGVPLVLAAAGVALGILGFLVSLAIALIKIAVVVAIIYLIIVGVRAMLKCLHIEPEGHDIALLIDVLLPFRSQQSPVARDGVRTRVNQIRVTDYFR